MKPLHFSPAFCCALGAAFSFYGLRLLFAVNLPPALALLLFLPALFLPAFIGVAARRKKRINRNIVRYGFICAVLYTAGLILGIGARHDATRQALVFPGISQEKVTALEGVLADDPHATRGERGIARLRLRFAYSAGNVRTSARGTALVFFSEEALVRLKKVGRAASVYIDGTFVLSQKSGQETLFRANSAHITRPAGWLDQKRTGLRHALIEIFDEKWGGLALALLLGIRDNLDGEIAQQYTKAGCSYILALSGMHLAIISSVITFLLKKPLGLKKAAFACSCFVVAYIFLVGAQASLCRAAIMYILGAFAVICMVPVTPFLLLNVSFLIQIAVNPLSGDSVSFILSYLALAGILIFSESVIRLLRGRIPDCVLSPLSASVAAFVATMAVGAAFFGELRFVGIFAGLLMVPFTTFFMVGAMAYIVLGFIPAINTGAAFVLNAIYLVLEKISFVASMAPPFDFQPTARNMLVAVIIPVLFLVASGVLVKKRYFLADFD